MNTQTHPQPRVWSLRSSLSSGTPVARLVLFGWFTALLLFFVVRTMHWPQVSDPAQMSYLCFLMDHGFAPYRYLIEMNMPGIYLANWSVAHFLGTAAIDWRIFDLSLLAAAGAAMVSIARTSDWFGGFVGAALFALFHAHDGPAETGQRDFIVAVLFLCAYALLFEAVRRRKHWLLFFFGFCCSAACTIKPQSLLLVLFLLAALFWKLRRYRSPVALPALFSIAGLAVPLLIVLVFLLRERALRAFFITEHTLLPYYATLGRQSALKLLSLCLSHSIGALLAFGVAVGFSQRRAWSWERTLLLAGMLFGAVSEVAQGKGFLYHRYPFAAFALLCVGMELATGMRGSRRTRSLAYTGLLYGAVVACLFAVRASHRTWDEAYNHALHADLDALGGTQLSGTVQCVTMAPDCATELYRMRLLQATGLVYDYFLFGPGNHPATLYTRQRFWTQFLQNRPRVVILGRWLYPEHQDDYSKLNRWPVFRDYLNDHYTLTVDRRFPPAMSGIRGYRIYLLQK